MARVTGPLMSMEASGTIGKTLTFANWVGRQYVRRWTRPSNPQTADQMDQRNAFSVIGVGVSQANKCLEINSSTTKTANGITLSLIDQNYTFSMDEGATWVTGATITTLAPSTASSSILIKDTVPPPMQLLGPRSPRIEARVGSWT